MIQKQIFIASVLILLCAFGCGTADNPVDVKGDDSQLGALRVEVEEIDGVSIHLRLLKDGQLMEHSVSDGIAEFDEIPVGEYTLKISAEGYQTTEQNVTINGNETVSLDKVILTKLSDSVVPGEGLLVGTKAPDFELPDGNGDMYSLSDYVGKDKKLVIVFYRTGG